MLRVNISRHQSILYAEAKDCWRKRNGFSETLIYTCFINEWTSKKQGTKTNKDDSKNCKVESLTPIANGLIILQALSSFGSHSWVRMAGQDNQLPGYIASDSGFERAVRHFPHLNNFSNQTSHPFKIPDQNLLPNSPLPGFASFCCL